jgi:hypothetical protein
VPKGDVRISVRKKPGLSGFPDGALMGKQFLLFFSMGWVFLSGPGSWHEAC